MGRSTWMRRKHGAAGQHPWHSRWVEGRFRRRCRRLLDPQSVARPGRPRRRCARYGRGARDAAAQCLRHPRPWVRPRWRTQQRGAGGDRVGVERPLDDQGQLAVRRRLDRQCGRRPGQGQQDGGEPIRRFRSPATCGTRPASRSERSREQVVRHPSHCVEPTPVDRPLALELCPELCGCCLTAKPVTAQDSCRRQGHPWTPRSCPGRFTRRH